MALPSDTSLEAFGMLVVTTVTMEIRLHTTAFSDMHKRAPPYSGTQILAPSGYSYPGITHTHTSI